MGHLSLSPPHPSAISSRILSQGPMERLPAVLAPTVHECISKYIRNTQRCTLSTKNVQYVPLPLPMCILRISNVLADTFVCRRAGIGSLREPSLAVVQQCSGRRVYNLVLVFLYRYMRPEWPWQRRFLWVTISCYRISLAGKSLLVFYRLTQTTHSLFPGCLSHGGPAYSEP